MQITDFDQLFPDNRESGETILRQAQLVMLRMFKIIDYICRKHNLRYWMCSGTLLGAIRHKGFIPWDDDLDICMIREDYEKFLLIAKDELPNDMLLQTRETDPLYDYIALPCKVRDTKSLIVSNGIEKKGYNMGLFIDIFPADRYHLDTKLFKKERNIKSFFFYLCKGIDAELEKKSSLPKKIISYFNPILKSIGKVYLKRINKRIDKNRDLGNNCYIGHGFDTPWRRYFNYEVIFPLQDYTFEGHSFLGPKDYDAYLSQLYGSKYMTPPPPEKRIQQHAAVLKPILNR